ncbi:MAG: aldo/keto reductase [Clostridium sp.]|nr:aldo/keto reductase [Clostridium sp.]
MIYSDFDNRKLSLLGFGAMRLPLVSDAPDAAVDETRTAEMVDYAISHGVNYFDTAYPYHNGESEKIMGRILKKYPREQFYLATKYPGHQISESYNPADIFEKQLTKCGVEYFDFYLLHNVYENSIQTYLDPKWGIIDYFIEQKKRGRIRYLGFSSHGRVDCLEQFLDICGAQMDFCQIQLNYLDWTLQNAKEKYDLLTKRNIPVWVMEPVRGGRLAHLDETSEKRLRDRHPSESVSSWAFRFLQGLPNVHMILSGMSNMEQMKDNVETFKERKPLNEEEKELLFEIAEGMKDSIPCTACRYCVEGCPKGLDIPMLLATYNEIRFSQNLTVKMRLDALASEKQPDACIKCGKCAKVCPQKINIPTHLHEFSDALAKMPSWAEMCRQRDAVQK